MKIIDENDQQMINIISNTEKISEIYSKLSELEINNLKDSDDYIKCVEKLKFHLDIERDLYSEISDDNINLGYYIGNFESLKKVKKDKEFPIFDRIINKLIILRGEKYYTTDNKNDNIIDNTVSEIAIKYFDDYINEHISDKSYKEYIPNLIKEKYMTIYFNFYAEQELAELDFKMFDNFFSMSAFQDNIALSLIILKEDEYLFEKFENLRKHALVNHKYYTKTKVEDSCYELLIQSFFLRGYLDCMSDDYFEKVVEKLTSNKENSEFCTYMDDFVFNLSRAKRKIQKDKNLIKK